MSIAAVSNDEDEVARRLQRRFCYTDIAENCVSCGAGQTRDPIYRLSEPPAEVGHETTSSRE